MKKYLAIQARIEMTTIGCAIKQDKKEHSSMAAK
jgi:hypothetical protein